MDMKDVRTGMPIKDVFFGTKGIIDNGRKLISENQNTHWYIQIIWKNGHRTYVRVEHIIPYRGKPKTI